jgi:hypothetical protein
MLCLRCRFIPATLIAALLATLACLAQDSSQSSQSNSTGAAVRVAGGTRLALVLTQPVQTRYIHHGDDIYAQVTDPVSAGNQVVIPPGTFVQGTVDKISRQGGRGEIRLQSMAITFPDGYVTPVAGPITLQTTDGYALKDPGSKRAASAILLPLAGVGAGALIGHSVGQADSTVTSNFPPGCMPPQFGCTTISTPVMGTKGKDTAIGAAIGGAAGMIASIFVLVSSHHYFMPAGAPVQATLQEPITLQENEVAKAIQQSQEHPAAIQPIMALPAPPSMPDTPTDHGTCYTPGTPGTPDTVIPGAPGPDGIPGPPTIIPGTPPTQGTPYPCP